MLFWTDTLEMTFLLYNPVFTVKLNALLPKVSSDIQTLVISIFSFHFFFPLAPSILFPQFSIIFPVHFSISFKT